MESFNRRLRLIHFSILTIQHLMLGSRLPQNDAFKDLVESDKNIDSGTISFGPTLGNPLYDKKFHYGLPTKTELQGFTDDQLDDALREAADPTFGAFRENSDDPESRIIHWMPTDIRWLHMTLIENEINRRSDVENRRHTYFLAYTAIGISVVAILLPQLPLVITTIRNWISVG